MLFRKFSINFLDYPTLENQNFHSIRIILFSLLLIQFCVQLWLQLLRFQSRLAGIAVDLKVGRGRCSATCRPQLKIQILRDLQLQNRGVYGRYYHLYLNSCNDTSNRVIHLCLFIVTKISFINLSSDYKTIVLPNCSLFFLIIAYLFIYFIF